MTKASDGVGALGEGSCVQGEAGLEGEELVGAGGVGGVEETAIVGFGAEDGDFHGLSRGQERKRQGLNWNKRVYPGMDTNGYD